jgi:hypothetical protein
MSSAKSTHQLSVWSTSHYDLGEIRTESADRSTPPEKKERLGDRGVNQKRLGNSKAPDKNICLLFRFLSQTYNLMARIFNNEFALAN